MFSEEEKRGFLEEACSLKRREDLKRVAENSASHRWTLEDYSVFLTAANRYFGVPADHPLFRDNGKFLI